MSKHDDRLDSIRYAYEAYCQGKLWGIKNRPLHPKVLSDEEVQVTNVKEDVSHGLLQNKGEEAEFKQ